MGEDKVKVLYIAGMGRSGSTILSNVLGEIEGFFHGGELRYIWDRNLIENRLCGCGAPFRECELWGRILREAYGGMDGIDSQEMLQLRQSSARTRHLPLMFVPGGERWLKSRIGKYLDGLEKLYRAIQSETGCRVIVDSSKNPAYGRLLEMIPTIDLYVLHLIRDSRGAAYSWSRTKPQPDIRVATSADGRHSYENMKRQNPFESSLFWDSWNLSIEMMWRHLQDRYLRLRYEDLIERPQRTLEYILDLTQEKPAQLPFLTEREVNVGSNHTVSGNPIRFQTGTIELRPDERWRTEMKHGDKALVTTLTWPLLLRYGYLD